MCCVISVLLNDFTIYFFLKEPRQRPSASGLIYEQGTVSSLYEKSFI